MSCGRPNDKDELGVSNDAQHNQWSMSLSEQRASTESTSS
jgi:hypothetical protein